MTDPVNYTDPKDIDPTEDDDIVREAQRRFHRCETWEAESRKLFLDDVKFANADADNGYQWPNSLRNSRDYDKRPCLTINKTRQHNLLIINDARQNKPSVKISPTGNGATYDSAEAFEGVVRHIEYISNAQAAYDIATKFQVDGGIGYLRLATDYAGEDSFDQEIYIRSIIDPLSAYLDPDAREPDKSDGRFGFIFDDMPREEFAVEHPKFVEQVGKSALGNQFGWIDDDHIRLAEYFRVVRKKDKLVAIKDPSTGKLMVKRWSELPDVLKGRITDDPSMKSREIFDNEVQWFLIAGDKIIDRTIWPGKYIPIIPVIGEETIIDGRLDRKGHTRAMKDPQRMLNYWSSAAVEQVALQGKFPFVGPAAAIEGLEPYWKDANRTNSSILPYNHRDDEGNEIPAPQRANPPQMAGAYIDGLKMSVDQMMEVSGQYQAQLGQPSNEKSGKAISERQRQGDRATYHFIDNLALAIRFVGRQLIDLIPKVYDTERVIRIMGEDGVETELVVNPNAQQAMEQQKLAESNSIRRIFNPAVGRYEVMADIGPAYATRRQEAFNAMSMIASQNNELMSVIGDLLFRNADFPGADKIAERLERMVPPQAKGEGPTPQEAQMQKTIQNLAGLLQTTTHELSKAKLQIVGKEQQKDINAYEAITKRLNVLFDAHEITPKDVALMLHDLITEQHSHSLATVSADDQNQITQEATGEAA